MIDFMARALASQSLNNCNSNKINFAAIMNGFSFKYISEEDFKALEPKENLKIYYVVCSNGEIKQYLGDVELSTFNEIKITSPESLNTYTKITPNAFEMPSGTVDTGFFVRPDTTGYTVASSSGFIIKDLASSEKAVFEVSKNNIKADSIALYRPNGTISEMTIRPNGIRIGVWDAGDVNFAVNAKNYLIIGNWYYGRQPIATGNNAIAQGQWTEATGSCSRAFGNGCIASGIGSTAMGGGTYYGSYYFRPTASGLFSFVNGTGVVAASKYQVVFGAFNDNKTNTLFEIGNGKVLKPPPGSDYKTLNSNAFEVYWSGVAKAQTAFISNDICKTVTTNIIINEESGTVDSIISNRLTDIFAGLTNQFETTDMMTAAKNIREFSFMVTLPETSYYVTAKLMYVNNNDVNCPYIFTWYDTNGDINFLKGDIIHVNDENGEYSLCFSTSTTTIIPIWTNEINKLNALSGAAVILASGSAESVCGIAEIQEEVTG